MTDHRTAASAPAAGGPKYPAPTKHAWNLVGRWRCVCTTPTHKRGQRFTDPQCQYCEQVKR